MFLTLKGFTVKVKKANAEILNAATATKPAPVKPTPTIVPNAQAVGYSLAQSIIGLAQQHAGELMRYVRRLAMVGAEARGHAWKELSKHDRQMNAHVQATSPTGKVKDGNPIFKGAKTSASTRLSEYRQIIKALDAGMDLQFKVDPDTKIPLVDAGGLWVTDLNYHTVVGMARAVLGSQAKGRGRPKTAFLDRLKKMVQEYAETPEDIKAGAELLATMAKLAK